MTDHQEVKICMGVKSLPGDSGGTESGYQEISLLNISSGIKLKTGSDGWVPQIAQAKPGVWRDEVYAVGRTPDAIPVANVTETLNCEIVAGTPVEVYRALEALNRFVQNAREYIESVTYANPVFLHWWAYGATGPQFARIYNMDVVSDPNGLDLATCSLAATLTIEREPAWRWDVPPGANPKLWTLRNQTGLDPATDYALVQNTNDMLNATIQNKYEINPADATTPISKNYIDIPASSIPGDAPALLTLGVDVDDSFGNPDIKRLFVGRSTKPTSITDRSGLSAPTQLYYMINAGDMTTTGSKVVATYGNISNGSPTNPYHVTRTIGASSSENTLSYTLRVNLLRGVFMVFLRCRQTNGASGDVQAQLLIGFTAGLTLAITKFHNLPLRTPSSGLGEYAPLYLGEITLPPNGAPMGNIDGRGLSDATIQLFVNLKNTDSGGSHAVQLLDLIFIPIDEEVVNMLTLPETGNIGQSIFTFDNSGYIGRGLSVGRAIRNPNTQNLLTGIPEVRGNLHLQPNVNNRLNFFHTAYDSSSVAEGEFSGATGISSAMNVAVNIVPRSYGPRTD